jgi:hypothetical protein
MNYLKAFIKSRLQTIFYYAILLCIAVFNIPFVFYFYLKDIIKATKSNERIDKNENGENPLESITEY